MRRLPSITSAAVLFAVLYVIGIVRLQRVHRSLLQWDHLHLHHSKISVKSNSNSNSNSNSDPKQKQTTEQHRVTARVGAKSRANASARSSDGFSAGGKAAQNASKTDRSSNSSRNSNSNSSTLYKRHPIPDTHQADPPQASQLQLQVPSVAHLSLQPNWSHPEFQLFHRSTIPTHVTHFYTNRRIDRVGAALQDYLMAHAFSYHAFSYHNQRIYGGPSCIFLGASLSSTKRQKYELLLESSTRDQMAMLQFMGLQDVIPLANDTCPLLQRKDSTGMILRQRDYFRFQIHIWTKEWIEHIKSKRKIFHTTGSRIHEMQDVSLPRNESVIAVHVRRGDVSPCSNYTYTRYLPNSHYISLIRKYQTPNHRVVLYSEPDSWESWTDFNVIDRLDMQLNATVSEVWAGLMDADILITSTSTFSIVPALFTRGKVVCTKVFPVVTDCLKFWESADVQLVQESQRQVQKMRQENCTLRP